jgi:hypothetical protein
MTNFTAVKLTGNPDERDQFDAGIPDVAAVAKNCPNHSGSQTFVLPDGAELRKEAPRWSEVASQSSANSVRYFADVATFVGHSNLVNEKTRTIRVRANCGTTSSDQVQAVRYAMRTAGKAIGQRHRRRDAHRRTAHSGGRVATTRTRDFNLTGSRAQEDR